MPKHKQIINVKLKYTIPDYKQLHKTFDYPIESMLKGDGYWTYTDYDQHEFPHMISGMPIICHNNGNKCHYVEKHDPYKCMDEDFEKCHHKHTGLDELITIMPKKLLNIDSWDKIYYQKYHLGESDFTDWYIACKNKDGVYIYIKASCDYTGFDCRGGGDISYSKNRETFWNFCLDQEGRNLLLESLGIKMKIDIPE